MNASNFPSWFKGQLRRRDWTQADFARRGGFSTGSVSNWATGQRLPDPSSCDLIADVFGVDRDDVLALAGHRAPDEPIAADDPRRQLHALIDAIDWRRVDASARRMIAAALEDLHGDQLKRRRRAVDESATR